MIRKYLLPLLALAGVIFAVFTVVKGQRQPPPAQPVARPSRAPFASYVAGAGLIEPSTENIAIGTPVGNVVTDVYVQVGDRVKKGQPLFRLRDSVTGALLETKKAMVKASEDRLARLRSLPRPEDIPPAEARVKQTQATVAEAQSMLSDSRSQLALWESVNDKRAVSQDEIDRKRFAVKTAEAKVAAAEAGVASATADLTLLKAGTWGPDLAVAEADLMSAKASVGETEAEIERRTIKSPIDGEVLQVKIRAGEYAQTGPLATPLMLVGNTDVYHVRVDVDENDAWRIQKDAPAEASLRGNADLKTALKFVRFEPYVVPKRSLTGDSTERVDTRVLQVVYAFERGKLPVYVGQQMDVFISAPLLGGATNPTSTPAQ